MNQYKIVEKKNTLHVHGYFSSYETANKHLKETIPGYVSKGFFVDKTLKANSFIIMKMKEN